MVANSHADALVTGLTRSFKSSFENISLVIDPAKKEEIINDFFINIKRKNSIYW